MNIINPPSPPFSKGGLGGFGIVLVIRFWGLEIVWDLEFKMADLKKV
jgi:hypothetical protein